MNQAVGEIVKVECDHAPSKRDLCRGREAAEDIINVECNHGGIQRYGCLTSPSGNGRYLRFCAAAFMSLVLTSAAWATPSQDDVFRSLTQNMDEQPDYSKLIPWFFAVAGVVATVVVVRCRQKTQATPRILNHPGKLIKELARTADIDPREMKKLKALAEELNCENPLTLLLCPSLTAKPLSSEASLDEVPQSPIGEPPRNPSRAA